jgi:branched-chain amino acid transport system substrate-binding protein
MKALIGRLAAGVLLAWASFAALPANAADTIKVAYVDPFSGPFASGGDQFLKVFNYIIDDINARGGALGRKFELVPFDDKLQPSEALIALKSITDQNIPFVMQCTGSNVGAALIDAVAKNNARNPDNRIIYMNCGALATELTNEKCDFWQFRFTGSVEQRAYARVKTLPQSVKKVYLLNQDYLFGQSVQHDTRKFLAQLRPDIQVVADELMPFGQVQDFSPYITKIKASGAESLITANYNRDLNLLIKAGNDAGLNIRYDTYLAHLIGGPTAIGAGGADKLTTITEYQENVAVDDFDFSEVPFRTMFEMLAAAINKTKSTDPLQVALALEGMHMNDMVGQENIMRKDDHQMLLPYYEAVFTRGVKYDSEHTGLGWKTEVMVPASELALPTTCKMKRPAS